MGYYNSFVIRIWSGKRGGTRGQIVHVPTRETMAFANPESIVAFVRGHLGPPPGYVEDPPEDWPEMDVEPVDREEGGDNRGAPKNDSR